MKNLCLTSFLMLFLFVIFLGSCELTPEGDYYVEVDPPEENPDVSFTLTPDPDSTIYLFEETNFNITAIIGYRIMRQVKVYVDEQAVHTGSGKTFSLDPVDFEPGFHQMEIEIIFSSGTGSLADIVGAENYVTTYFREIYMDGQTPEPLNINSITVTDDGRLRIDWNIFESIKFEKYVLCRRMTLGDSRNLDDTLEIMDMYQNWWIDSTIIYGMANYSLFLFTKFADPLQGEESEIFFYYPDCSIDIDESDMYNLDASWEPCQLFGNLKEYNISISNPDTAYVLYSSTDPTETMASFHVGIRKPSTYTFRDISDSSSFFQGGGSYFSKQYYLGTHTVEYELMQHAPDGLFAIDYYRLYHLDNYGNLIDNSNSLFSPASFIGVSDNGNFVMTNHDKALVIFDPSNLGNVDVIQISEITGEESGVVFADVSDNGTIIAMLENGKILGYNYPENELLFLINQPDAKKVIADVDGEYFLIWEDKMGSIIQYHYEGLPSPIPLQVGEGYGCPVVYKTGNQTRFLTMKNGNLEIRDLVSLVSLENKSVGFDEVINLSDNNILFGVDHEHVEFHFYNLSEMELILASPTDYIDDYLLYRYPTLFVKNRKFTLDF